MDAEPKLLVQVRSKLRARHYSYRTEQQYLAWIRRFILQPALCTTARLGVVSTPDPLTWCLRTGRSGRNCP